MIEILNLIIMPIAITLILASLFEKIYHRHYKSKYLYLGIYFVLACSICGINMVKRPFLNIMFWVFSINGISMVFYKGKIKRKLFYNNIIIVLLFFCDVLAVSIWMVMKNVSFYDTINHASSKNASVIIDLLLLALVYYIMSGMEEKSHLSQVKLKETILFSFVTFFQILFVGIAALGLENRYAGIFFCCFY